MPAPNEPSPLNRIINRHKARTLGELEDAGCPDAFVKSVASNLNWLRFDLNKLAETEGGE